MREVSNAASYNSAWKPPRREYGTPQSSLPSSPVKSPSPSRPLLASPHTRSFVAGQPNPSYYQDRPAYSPSRNTGFTRAEITVPQSAMASRDSWGPAQNHDYYNVPAPPTRQYRMNDSVNDDHADYSYSGHDISHGYDQSPVSPQRPGLVDPYARGDDPFARPGSYYESGAYPDISPSPARHSRLEFDAIDPHSIADGPDDRDDFPPQRATTSGMKRFSKKPVVGAAAVGALGAGAAAGTYSAVGQSGSTNMLTDPTSEKAAWRDMDELDRKKRKRKIWIIIAVIALLAVIGGVVGGVLGSRSSGSSNSDSGSSGSNGRSDGMDLNSKEIKALMNNKDLHKVFPVMDYTAYNTLYPYCLSNPASQDNVTMDMAVLSQLTPAIRVYGTDCNQTEMIFTAIDRLGLNDTMKVWLGIWIDGNSTTNERQINHAYDLLRTYPQEHFMGVIVGNEALFREEITEWELTTLIGQVKSNLTEMGISLSVSTSDLGSAWTTSLAAASDHVMGNIHPFFAGVPAADAAGWTYVFWQGNNVAIAPEPANAQPGAIPRNIVAEVGWPSGGGNTCGPTAECTSSDQGSVAGVEEMNDFMNAWICEANNNGTMYFWFEAFDEPWKVRFNTADEQWEDKWGLMTIDRKLKPGIQIPDCGGKTVSLPSM